MLLLRLIIISVKTDHTNQNFHFETGFANQSHRVLDIKEHSNIQDASFASLRRTKEYQPWIPFVYQLGIQI
jgi:hypothetical protein